MKKIMRLFLAIAMVCVMLVPVYGAQSTAYTPTDGDVIFVPGKASLTGANEAYIINSATQTVGTKVSVQFPEETDMADGYNDQLTGRFWEMKDGVPTRIYNVVHGTGTPQYGYHDGIAGYNSAAGTLLLLDIANHKGSGNACGHKFAESCGVSTYQNHRGANELGPTVSVDANTKVIDLRVDVLGGITQPATTVAEVAALAVTTNGATTAPAYMVNTYAADAQATTQTDYATNAGTVDVFVLMDASADTKPAITVSAGTVLFRVGKPAWNTDTFIYVDGAYPELVGKTVTATYSGGRHEGQPNYSDQGNFWHTWNNKIVPEGCLQSDGVTANSNLTDTSHNAVAAILGTTMYTVNATGHTSATAGENSCINVCTQSTEVANADIANAAIVDLTGSGIDSIDSLKAAVAKGTVIVNFMAENGATDLVIVTGAAQDGVSYADQISYKVSVTDGTVLFRVGKPAWSSDTFVYVDGDYPELVGKTVTATYSGRWEGQPNYSEQGNFWTYYNGNILPESCLQGDGVNYNSELADTMHDVVVSIDNSNVMATANAPGHDSATAADNSCKNGCAHSSEVKSVDITDATIVDLSGNGINTIDALKTAAGEYNVIVNFIAQDGATDLVIVSDAADKTKYNVTVADGIQNGTVTVDITSAPEGTVVTVTATPAEGYELEQILVDGVAITGNTFQISATGANVVSATFKKAPVTVTVTTGTVLFRVGQPAWSTDTFIYVAGDRPELVGQLVKATYTGRWEGKPDYTGPGNFFTHFNGYIVPEGCLQSDGATANNNLADTSHNAVGAVIDTTMYTVNAIGHNSTTASENVCVNGCAQSNEIATVDISGAAIVDLSGSGINSIETLKAAAAKGTVIVNYVAADGATDLVIVSAVTQDGVSYADQVTCAVPVTDGTVLFRVGKPAWTSDTFVYVDGDYPELVGRTVTATYGGRHESGNASYSEQGNFWSCYNGNILPEGCLHGDGVNVNAELADTMHDAVVTIDNNNVMTTGNAPGHSNSVADVNSCKNGCAHSSEVKRVDITDAVIVDLSGNGINSIDSLKAAVAKGTVIVNFIAEQGAADLVIVTGAAEDGKTYGIITVTATDNGSVAVDESLGVIGETVTVTATPDAGYCLDKVLVDGVAIKGTSFTVSGNHTVSAVFVSAVDRPMSGAVEAGDVANGGDYLLTGDVTISGTAALADGVTIDLGGYTVTGLGGISGTVTIMDSSAEQTGKVMGQLPVNAVIYGGAFEQKPEAGQLAMDDAYIITEKQDMYQVTPGFANPGAIINFGSSLNVSLPLVGDNGVPVSGAYTVLLNTDNGKEYTCAVEDVSLLADQSMAAVVIKGVAAKEMRDEFTVTVSKDGVIYYTDTISVYETTKVWYDAAEEGIYKTMLADMLNYGAAAQEEFEYGIVSDEPLNGTAVAPTWAALQGSGVSGGNGSKVQYTLSLKDKIQLNVYINDEDAAISNVTFKGNSYTAYTRTTPTLASKNGNEGKTVTLVSFGEINVVDADEQVSFTVTPSDGSEAFTVTYSIHDYVVNALGKNQDAVLKALQKYVDSVSAYISANS